MNCTCVIHTASGTSWLNPKCPAHGQPPVTLTVVGPLFGVAQPASNTPMADPPANPDPLMVGEWTRRREDTTD